MLILISKQNPAESSVIFIRKGSQRRGTYEIYWASSAEAARAFLKTKKIREAQCYIEVETPEGTWGLDKDGLYLQKLLPFQTVTSQADCKGSICELPSEFAFSMAARKISDNFVVTVECGRCGHQWEDGVRFKDTTVVRCPECQANNWMDTKSLQLGDDVG